MPKRYVLKLTGEEREILEALTRKGTNAARKLQKARALLLCDQGETGPAWRDADVAEAVGATTRSLESWRRRACEAGPVESLDRRPRSRDAGPKLDGRQEARLVQLACSAPPEGRVRWSLRLLAARMVELQVVGSLSRETVRRALQKTRSSRG